MITISYCSHSKIFSVARCCALSIVLSTFIAGCKSDKKDVVAITQFAPHPSLDLIRKGIEDGLQGKNYAIQFQNAQGNCGLSVQIAQKFAHSQAKIIIPITTPSTLSVYKVAQPSNIPVVFSGVTDPVSVKLSDAHLKPQPGITGVRDYLSPEKQIAFLKSLFKGTQRTRIGTLYTVGESNAVAQVEAFESALNQSGFSFKKVPIHQTADVAQATRKLAMDVDLILIFNDNTVVSAMPQIVQIAKEKNIPVVATDPESVKFGAVAALAYDQYAMGKQTAELALKVLEGQLPENLPIETADEMCIYIHEKMHKHFNLSTPTERLKIIRIGEKE
ncbi:MAG: hypothetical protein NEHIOOID_00446 [Holosporales bacterium]